MLEINRQALQEFLNKRDDVDVVPTKFGTTSFPRIKRGSVEKLCALLIEKYETAVVPGCFFESPQHIRIGMCCESKLFCIGVERLGRALDELGG
jgi:aspartate/methionine/tyrosine aminotransferase